MRRFILMVLAAMCVAIALVSCGEDRTVELEEKTQHNRWVMEQMRDRYLWADSLHSYEPEWKSYFAAPADFLKTVIGKTKSGEKWSYVSVDTVKQDMHPNGHFNHINSYGFDFVLMNDPTGKTTKQFARVLTVYGNSAASRAGLRRDDFISAFDGYKLSQKNQNKLEKGGEITLTVQNLAVDGEEFTLVNEHSVRLEASSYVEDYPYPVSDVLYMYGHRVGYLMCTRLLLNGAEDYVPALDGIMERFKREWVNEVVLDLRLCNDGTLEAAQYVASCVVNPTYTGRVFAKTIHNAAYASEDATLTYLPTSCNLGVERVFVIASDRTQGAAEWLIHGLKTTMGDENVIVVGRATAGQNVITQYVGSAFNVSLFPAVAFVADGEGNHDYHSISPTESMDETSFAFLGQYGVDDPLLMKAVDMMTDE